MPDDCHGGDSVDDYLCNFPVSANSSVDFLARHSEHNHNDFCLSFLLTNNEFFDGSLGSAYQAHPLRGISKNTFVWDKSIINVYLNNLVTIDKKRLAMYCKTLKRLRQPPKRKLPWAWTQVQFGLRTYHPLWSWLLGPLQQRYFSCFVDFKWLFHRFNLIPSSESKFFT